MSERILPPASTRIPAKVLSESESGAEEESLFLKIIICLLLILEIYFFIASMYEGKEIVPQDFRTMENEWSDNWLVICTFHSSYGIPAYEEASQVIHANDTWIVRGLAEEIRFSHEAALSGGKEAYKAYIRMHEGQAWSLPTEFTVSPLAFMNAVPEKEYRMDKKEFEFVFAKQGNGYEIRRVNFGYIENGNIDLKAACEQSFEFQSRRSS
jgi:hypothetical protein